MRKAKKEDNNVKEENMEKCSICGKNYEGYGNNAQPVNDGRCCDKCNLETVIPRRITESMMLKEEQIHG